MNQGPSTTEEKQMRPIIFSTPMVQAILAGRKTQTRRIAHVPNYIHEGINIMDWGLSKHPFFDGKEWRYHVQVDVDECATVGMRNPYGKVGDILYVRETWCWDYKDYPERTEKYYFYKADTPENYLASGERWYPSIHMPRAAARIFLKITDISVERLQDITEEDAQAEGVEKSFAYEYGTPDGLGSASTWRAGFKRLWGNINGEGSWEQNPWIWKISFEQTTQPKEDARQ